LVEREPSKLEVAGSSPVSRSDEQQRLAVSGKNGAEKNDQVMNSVARVAQSVEHSLGKGEVTGSIPVASLGRQGLAVSGRVTAVTDAVLSL
jgi:hypothetical protein